jgi:antitoxin MazE
MRTRIVNIGNSQGVRIPKALLEESGLSGEVDITVHDGALVIAAAGRARVGWDEAFRQMALRDDDELLDGDVTTADAFEMESWQWE